MEVIFVTFVSPSSFLSHVFSYKTHLYLQSPHPNHKKHTPGVIQPSPHTHPNHKNSKMRDVIHSSPNSSISTPPSPPESWRWLSCFCYLANLACVLFRSCVHFRLGTNSTTTKPPTNAHNSFGQGRVFFRALFSPLGP